MMIPSCIFMRQTGAGTTELPWLLPDLPAVWDCLATALLLTPLLVTSAGSISTAPLTICLGEVWPFLSSQRKGGSFATGHLARRSASAQHTAYPFHTLSASHSLKGFPQGTFLSCFPFFLQLTTFGGFLFSLLRNFF